MLIGKTCLDFTVTLCLPLPIPKCLHSLANVKMREEMANQRVYGLILWHCLRRERIFSGRHKPIRCIRRFKKQICIPSFFPFIIIFPFKKTTFNNKSINNMKKYYKYIYICFKSCSWCASILCIGLLSAICHRKKGSDSLRKNTPKNTQFFTVKFFGSINDILKPTAHLENPLSTKNN